MTSVLAAVPLHTLLALDKETLMIGALASMVVAGLIVAVGAWTLFRRERRAPGDVTPPR